MRLFFISISDIWRSLNIYSKVYVDQSDVEGFKIHDISNAPISLFRKAMKTHEFIMQMYDAAAHCTNSISRNTWDSWIMSQILRFKYKKCM